MSDESSKSISTKSTKRSVNSSTKDSGNLKKDNNVETILAELRDKNINAEQPSTSFYKDMKWDWCISGSLYLRQIIFEKIFPAIEGINIDRLEFIDLFAWSFSLSISEKNRVINSWPTLSQHQCDALRETFVNERNEFNKLISKEKDIIHGLLLKCMMDWVYIVYGDTRVAAATALESFQSEAFGIEYLPFPNKFFKRDENFYIKLTIILLRIGAPPEVWQASMHQAQKKRNTEIDVFWREMLHALQESPNSISQMRNMLTARIYVGEIAIDETKKDDEFKYRTLIAQGRSHLQLDNSVRAIEYFTDAYNFAVSKLELTVKMRNMALREILEAKSLALYPLEVATKDFFDFPIWSKITNEILESLYHELSLKFLFIGQGRLALELVQDYVDVNDDVIEKSLDIFSIAMYIGEFDVADIFVKKHFENEVEPNISEFLSFTKNEEQSINDHFNKVSKQSFELWMHYMCTPSDTLKNALDAIYGRAYNKWLQHEYLRYPDKTDWCIVHFGLALQNICNDLPVGTDRLISLMKNNRARLFILDNLYVASGFFARRGEMSKVIQLSRVAKEVYSIGNDSLLGQSMPLIDRFAAFAEQDANDALVFAGHPDEVKKFEGTWTLELFKKLLAPSQK